MIDAVALWRISPADFPRAVAALMVDRDMTHAEYSARLDAAAAAARSRGVDVHWIDASPEDMLLALAAAGQPNTPQGRAVAMGRLLGTRRGE